MSRGLGDVYKRQDALNKDSKAVKVTADQVKKSMVYLSSDALEGRATGSRGIEMAAAYIEDYLKTHGIVPYFDSYRDHFEIKMKKRADAEIDPPVIEGFNVVGYIEGQDANLKDEFIIIGGHYDHIGKGKIVNGDSIANGANDDASGTVVAMELAKHFARSGTNKRSILVTLFSAEELGLKGSSHLAKRLKEKGLDIYTMINFEMVGVPRSSERILSYMSGYERSNFAVTLNRYAGSEIVGFFPQAKQFQLFMRSDNFPFYKEFNIPAHAISTFDFSNYDYYHHVDDEWDQMDFVHMAHFINALIPAFEGMINANTKEVVLKNE